MSTVGLSVDLGTSHTVAVLRGDDGTVSPLLMEWYRKAAETGHANAMNKLADLLEQQSSPW